jgi:hypothetical protein
MFTMLTDDELFARLKNVDPASALVPDEKQMMSALASATVGPRKTRSRVFLWVAILVAGVVTLGAVSPAVADGVHHFFAQTGWFGSPNLPGVGESPTTTTESDNSEWINTGRSDFVAYSASIFPSYISLPVGYDRATYASAVAKTIRPPQGGLMQATGIVDDFETYSRCVWMQTWLAADSSHDTAAMKAAASVLTTSATWPATVATDGGGMVAGFEVVASGASRGDPTPVQHEYLLNCPVQPVGKSR